MGHLPRTAPREWELGAYKHLRIIF
jgi:hypothetical protein